MNNGSRPPASSLGKQVRSSLGWGFAGNFIGRASSFLLGVVLARLLLPRDYGLFAVALVALLFVLSLNDVGLAATIVRWPGDLDRVAPTATTIIFMTSLLLYAALFLIAPFLATAMRVPTATGLIRLMAVGVVIDGAFVVPTVLLTRNFQQDRRTAADLAGLAVSAILTIGLALHGLGAWSLAWGRLAGNATVGASVFFLAPARYWPGFRSADARRLLAFGLPLGASSLLTVAIANVDVLIVGRILGSIALGFYVLAVNISTWPSNLLFAAVRRVSLAGFSRLQDDLAALRSSFFRALTLLMLVAFPISVLMAVLAVPLVTVVYGERWGLASSVLPFLALAASLKMGFGLMDDLLVAAGKPKTIMWLQVAWLVALVPGLAIGATVAALRGVGVGYLAACLVLLPLFLLATDRLGLRWYELLRPLVRPFIGAAAAAAAALVLEQRLPPGAFRLGVPVAVGLALYVAIVSPMRFLFRSGAGGGLDATQLAGGSTTARVGVARYARTVLKRYVATIPVLWAETSSLTDFVRLIRVRLAKSKLGWLTSPRRFMAIVNLKTLGKRIHLRSHTTDISVLSELLEGGSYAPVLSVLNDARVIVDLGANTGLSARWFLHYYPRARIIAVEPEPRNVAVLRSNLEALGKQAEVVVACVGARKRRVGLVTTQGEFAFRMQELGETVPLGATVDVVTLEEILATANIDHIDLLKCDIEGAESELFANCASWIGSVQCATVECHAPYTAARLVQDLAFNGATFELTHLELNPAYSCEVATLRRRG